MTPRRRGSRAIAILLVLLCASPSVRAADRGAINAIERHRGRVQHEDLDATKPIVEVEFSDNAKFSDKDLKTLAPQLKSLAKLRELKLAGTAITDSGVASLKDLSGLESLTLDRTKITDQGLSELKGLASLKSLSIVQTNVTAQGLAALKKAMPGLKVIYKAKK